MSSPVESKLTSLDSFGGWRNAMSEQQAAFNALPWDINPNDADQLRQQLGYLDAQQAQSAARQVLMLEIASQDEVFLPLPYRLGAIAAFEATNTSLKTKYNDKGWSSRGESPFHVSRGEQRIRPSKNPIELAEQVGDELVRLGDILDTKRSVPVVMVWNNRFIPPRVDYDEVVVGKVPNPREAFVLEEPTVDLVEGERTVGYDLPTRLHGVEKGEVIRADMYLHPEEKYKNPAITTLVKLGVARKSFVAHDPDALYVGTADVKERVAQARKDNARYDSIMQSRRGRRRRRSLG